MRTLSLLGAVGLLAITSSVGCSSDSTNGDGGGGDGNTGSVESTLEIFSWWIAPGEVEALDALVGVYVDEYPNVKVTNAAAIDAETQRARLKTRLETGEPPDSFQALSGVDLMTWVDKEKMAPLQDLAAENGWDSGVYPQALLDIVSRDGVMYGVPLNIERDNNLYYNKALFTQHDVTPPASLDDFYAACDKLKAGGLEHPLAVPAAGWVLALVTFETLMPAVTGGKFYRDYFSGNADPNDPRVEELFTNLKRVLECSDVAIAADAWGSGGDALYRGDSAMYVMGDWGKAYLESGHDADGRAREPWVADEDFGVVPGLGSQGYFTFNSTVFGLPKGAPHPKAARAFVEVVGSQ
ncbi:MAG TPA: extracellular solute-binding protein, partial [Polyangiaceae bacterium]|nr:extracellular solute-binding protein [Polyangiaceae bacterium]